MATFAFVPTPEEEAFIGRQVAAGKFKSAEDVVVAALEMAVAEALNHDSVRERFLKEYPHGTLAILERALDLAKEAIDLVWLDCRRNYLANQERQRAMERVLSLFGQALHDLRG